MKYDEAKQLYKFDVYEEIPANGFCFVLAQSKTTGDACLYKKTKEEMKELMHSTSDPGNLLGLVKENDAAAYVVTDSGQKVFGLNLSTSDIAPLFCLRCVCRKQTGVQTCSSNRKRNQKSIPISE